MRPASTASSREIRQVDRRLAAEPGFEWPHGRMLAARHRAPAAGPVRQACGHRAASGSAPRRPRRSARGATGQRSGTASRRSEAKRSSGTGQSASSAPTWCASRTRLSTIAASASRATCPAERRWPIPLQERTEHRGRGPLTGTPRPEPALLDEGSCPRRGAGFQPAEVRGRDPPGDQELGVRVIDHGPHTVHRSTRRLGIGRVELRRPSTAEEYEVERAVDVDAETPSAAPVVDGHAGDLLEPARQRVVGCEVGEVGEGRASAGDGDDIGRIPVVGQRLRQRRCGGRHKLPEVGRGRERDRAGAEDHEPAIADLGDESREARSRTVAQPPGPCGAGPASHRRRGSHAGADRRDAAGRPRSRRSAVRHPDPARHAGSRHRPRSRVRRRARRSSWDPGSSPDSKVPSMTRPSDRSRVRRPRREPRRCRTIAGGRRHIPRGAAGSIGPRGLAPLRDGAVGRHGPARVPQRCRPPRRLRGDRRSREDRARPARAAQGDRARRGSPASGPLGTARARPGSPDLRPPSDRRRAVAGRPLRRRRDRSGEGRQAAARSRIGTSGSGCSSWPRSPTSPPGSCRPVGPRRSRHAADRSLHPSLRGVSGSSGNGSRIWVRGVRRGRAQDGAARVRPSDEARRRRGPRPRTSCTTAPVPAG